MRSNIFLASCIVLLTAVFLFRKAPLPESQAEPVQIPVPAVSAVQPDPKAIVSTASSPVSQPAATVSSTTPATDLRASMAESLRHDDDGLVKEVNPDGSVTVHLQGRFQHAPTATINRDGTVSYGEL